MGLVAGISVPQAAPAAAGGILEKGKVWPGWKRGEFQTHFIYTGRSESVFMIFPDGTTMLVDCGDYDVTRDICRASFEPGHVVVSVAPGGDTYTVSYIEAADESMVVRDVMRFRSADHA